MLTYAVYHWNYGAHAWDFYFPDLVPLIPLISSAGVFSICACTWSKTSFAVTLLRLTDGWKKWVIWYIIISMNLAMAVTSTLPFVSCTPIYRSWNPTITEGSCFDQKIIVNFDIFSAGESALGPSSRSSA